MFWPKSPASKRQSWNSNPDFSDAGAMFVPKPPCALKEVFEMFREDVRMQRGLRGRALQRQSF